MKDFRRLVFLFLKNENRKNLVEKQKMLRKFSRYIEKIVKYINDFELEFLKKYVTMKKNNSKMSSILKRNRKWLRAIEINNNKNRSRLISMIMIDREKRVLKFKSIWWIVNIYDFRQKYIALSYLIIIF